MNPFGSAKIPKKTKAAGGIFSGFALKQNGNEEFPILPLRDIVIFPQTLVSLFITYKSGIAALEEALARELRLFAVCQKNSDDDNTYDAGTVVRIVQNLRLPDNTFRVVLQGEYRALLASAEPRQGFRMAKTEPIQASAAVHAGVNAAARDAKEPEGAANLEIAALMRAAQKSFAQYAEYTKKISAETITAVEKAEGSERLANLVGNVLAIKPSKKVELLGIVDPGDRLEKLLEILEQENEIFGIQKSVSEKVRSRMAKGQRDHILHEQLLEIHKELGKDSGEDDFSDLARGVEERKPGAEVLAKARKELARLKKLQPFSPEAGVLRGYLEWLADLPWSEYSADSADLGEAERILDEDHYGMKKPKERIVEYIAVRQLSALEFAAGPAGENGESPDGKGESAGAADADAAGDAETPFPENGGARKNAAPPAEKGALPSGGGTEEAAGPAAETLKAGTAQISCKGPILCFVGPPGTGKTSLGKSVARALGRKFVRISLGGVRDEAEIRGHRKTYVGALPGKIIQSMRKAGTMNPVFLLDEIDKLSNDYFRGDPSSALLEVLDPEQNSAFTDHYLEVPYDLSKVLFITTANSLHGIPLPLLDRMEVIEVPGYGDNEKLAIAQKFLVPKELAENGLSRAKISFKEEAIIEIIRHWTMESGVRGLEREIARCVRRIAREAVNKKYGQETDKPIESFKKNVRREDLDKLLGRRKYKNDVVFKEARMGVSYGLAWTESGGTMLPVESTCFEGGGDCIITGNLGDVMKESARIALSYLRSVQSRYSFRVKDVGKTDFHIHVPEGAIPKDGPSAGITLAASLFSTLCQVLPKPGIAMTGELTLTGRILPIGGLKEKLLAAIRNGMEEVLLPEDNREDWEELDEDIRKAANIHFVENAGDVFERLFGKSVLKKVPKKKAAGDAVRARAK